MTTYTDVGDDGIELGEREPKRWVRRCWELRLERRRSREGLARLVLDVMCRNSAGEEVVEFIVADSVAAEWEAREMRGEEGALRFEESWERVAMVDDSRREVDGGEKVEVYYTALQLSLSRRFRNARLSTSPALFDYLPFTTSAFVPPLSVP